MKREKREQKARSAFRLVSLATVLMLSAGVASAQTGNTCYHYDALGRLSRVDYRDNSYRVLNYDPAGNRNSVASNAASPPPAFAVNDVSISEAGVLTFTITKTGASSGIFSINWTTAPGTASAGSDYTTASGALSFAGADTAKTVSVQTLGDSTPELNETVLLNLFSPSCAATIADSQGVGTIIDSTPPPSFSIADMTATEGGTFTFTVSKSGTTAQTFSVNYATADGTATVGADYASASGTLTFAAAETSKSFTVTTVDDSAVEGTENFFVNLSGATGGAQLSDGQSLATLNDNDTTAAQLSISDAIADEGGVLEFVVTRTGYLQTTHAVTYATANGTAVSPGDYGATSGVLTFNPNETSKTISVNAIFDAVNNEPDPEYMYLNLSSPTNGATITDSQGVGEITKVLNCGGVPC